MHYIYLVHSVDHKTKGSRLALAFSKTRAMQLKHLAQKNAPGELDVSISTGFIDFGTVGDVAVEVVDRLFRFAYSAWKVFKPK